MTKFVDPLQLGNMFIYIPFLTLCSIFFHHKVILNHNVIHHNGLYFAASSCSERLIPWPDNTPVRCNYSGPVANFTTQMLKEIPTSNISAQTVCFFLSKNYITEIGQQLWHFQHLELLELSSNDITEIHKLAFQSSTNLKVLVLSDNFLKFVTDNVPIGTFNFLDRLEVLHIENQKGGSWNATYRDDLFSHLSSLKELHLDGLKDGKVFGKGFRMLTHLKSLALYGDFDLVGNDTFASFNHCNLTTLAVRSKKLYDIQPLGLSYFPHLSTLNLNDNPLLGYNNMSAGLESLTGDNPKDLYFQSISASLFYANITYLNGYPLFETLKNIHTRSLFLD